LLTREPTHAEKALEHAAGLREWTERESSLFFILSEGLGHDHEAEDSSAFWPGEAKTVAVEFAADAFSGLWEKCHP
jgi:hypothetical protein